MGFSKFLASRLEAAKLLVNELSKEFKDVSVLGNHIKSLQVNADKKSSNIAEGRDTECGFVVKVTNGKGVFEYSCTDILNTNEVAKEIISSFKKDIDEKIVELSFNETKLVKDFVRESDFENYSEESLLQFCKKLVAEGSSRSNNILNFMAILTTQDISKLYVSNNRVLTQSYTWVNGFVASVYRENNKVVYAREGANANLMGTVIKELPLKVDALLKKASNLTKAKAITPGYYDIITDPSITGLIAHEAFGHGVEMDQFVKDRALGKKYVNDYVASPIVNMKDGAAAAFSVASYFFDDNGVLAGDTQIIKDGILITGISDAVAASELGMTPTGNGRRESYKRKAYSRMTNTFFEGGNDNLDDMIKSIKHGYLLCETSNGMEDPKNWAIQCVCNYGIEIIDGKLTDNYVSPVVMSGYVPDLLKSISMISKDVEIEGSGSCGKGYKEWVRVSDGGPYLKAKVKLA